MRWRSDSKNHEPAKRLKAKRGFTLIKLLAVIAIIAILAAMLMPTLSRARSQASKVTGSNTRRAFRGPQISKSAIQQAWKSEPWIKNYFSPTPYLSYPGRQTAGA